MKKFSEIIKSKATAIVVTIMFIATVGIANAQDYNGTFTLNIQSYHDGHTHDHDKMSITYSFDGNRIAMLIAGKDAQTSRMILDHNKKIMTALSEQAGNKSGVIMKMTDEMYQMAKNSYDSKAEDNKKATDQKWSKTGRTKEIEGMTASELAYEAKDGKGTMWITDEMGLHFASLMGIMKSTPNASMGASQFGNMYSEGFPLEINSQTTDGKDISKMWISDIKDEADKSYFNTDGYSIQDMSNFDMQNYQNYQGK